MGNFEQREIDLRVAGEAIENDAILRRYIGNRLNSRCIRVYQRNHIRNHEVQLAGHINSAACGAAESADIVLMRRQDDVYSLFYRFLGELGKAVFEVADCVFSNIGDQALFSEIVFKLHIFLARRKLLRSLHERISISQPLCHRRAKIRIPAKAEPSDKANDRGVAHADVLGKGC